jgi:chromosome segregation ATPase
MLQSEFETLTGIYPDVLLYEAAEHEYNTGDFASKAEFCDCFKADEDGLAQKCRNSANERWLAEEELIGKLRAENTRLEDENENLRNEIGALHDRVDRLIDKIGELKPQGFTPEQIRAAMQQSLADAACDDNKADMILHTVWGFGYLLVNLGVE